MEEPTPEQLEAIKRMDAERKDKCAKILERYEQKRLKQIEENEKPFTRKYTKKEIAEIYK